jgi:hypothetical protein
MTPAEAPTTDQPVIRITCPRDLVDLVPYLVGFWPTESLVLVSLRGSKRRVGLTLRIDLDGVRSGSEALDSCATHLARAGARSVMILIYRDRVSGTGAGNAGAGAGGRALPDARLAERVRRKVRTRGVEVDEALLVTRDRWWSYLCDDQSCCPPEGHRIAPADRPSPVVAAATVAGLVAAPDRGSLERSVEPAPAADREAVAALVADAQARNDARGGDDDRRYRAGVADEVAAAVAGQRSGRTRLDDDVVARLLVAFRDIGIRDQCCGYAAGGDSAAMQSLSMQLARRATAPYDVAPYTVLAWCAWRDGNGALARIAVERALRSDGGYALATLLEQALDCGIDPGVWRDPR